MKKPLIIGIAGGSASGKTTVCTRFEEKLNAFKLKTFHIDEYYKDEKPFITAPITRIVYEDHNHPDAIDFCKFDADLLLATEEDFDIVIVEGLMALSRDEIREKLDYKIFVDCQADERIVRRLKRNMVWGLGFDEISSVYLDAVRYRHNEFVEPSKWHSDIIFNGSMMSKKAIDSVVKWIESQILK